VIWGTYTDGDILGSSKKPIDEDTHEGGIESILGREVSENSICHSLGNDHTAHGDA
jgi:hypothetical protein